MNSELTARLIPLIPATPRKPAANLLPEPAQTTIAEMVGDNYLGNSSELMKLTNAMMDTVWMEICTTHLVQHAKRGNTSFHLAENDLEDIFIDAGGDFNWDALEAFAKTKGCEMSRQKLPWNPVFDEDLWRVIFTWGTSSELMKLTNAMMDTVWMEIFTTHLVQHAKRGNTSFHLVETDLEDIFVAAGGDFNWDPLESFVRAKGCEISREKLPWNPVLDEDLSCVVFTWGNSP
jgi:hypothetical protein